ncbi:MAG: DUF2933 domain-containing protein [Clostridia bacterium]|nr:MAG: DUF2933 domain-containing protein [Clostridia bacterium]
MLVAAFFFLSGTLSGSGEIATGAAEAATATPAAGNWIWLLLLACPLMHLFMMGGHGHGQEAGQEKGADKAAAELQEPQASKDR